MHPILLILPTLGSIVGYILLTSIWWRTRTSKLFISIPWICTALLYSSSSHLWMKPLSSAFIDSARAAGNIDLSALVYNLSITLFLISGIAYFLKVSMIAINCVFLMSEIHPVNRFYKRIANLQRYQHLFGALLLAILILPAITLPLITKTITK